MTEFNVCSTARCRLFLNDTMLRYRKKLKLLLGFVVIVTVMAVWTFLPRKNLSGTAPRAFSKSWHHVTGTTYMYSAFWDHRDRRSYVRVIAVGPYHEQLTQIRCSVKYGGEKSASIVPSTFHIMDFDNHDKNHSVVFFLCYPLIRSKPSYVALVGTPHKLSKWIPVQSMNPEGDIKDRIAVCIRPLFGKYPEDLSRLVEFVAFYMIMGATHFVFYDYTADYSVKRVLKLLATHDVSLEVLPWDIPEALEHSWQFGQVASITDCVYRMASTHEYVVIADIDEFIVPKKNVTLQTMLQFLTGQSTYRTASYVFRHSFFCMDYPDDKSGSHLPLHLLTQTKTMRKPLTPLSNRAKSVVRPLAIIFPGIHRVQLAQSEWQSVEVVDTSIATLHHYREGVCSFWGRFGYGTLEDFTALKFRNDLLKSFPIKMWLKLNGY